MSTRQAKYEARRRRMRRTLGLCQKCGAPKPCGRAYCGRNAEARRIYQRNLMRERRERGIA